MPKIKMIFEFACNEETPEFKTFIKKQSVINEKISDSTFSFSAKCNVDIEDVETKCIVLKTMKDMYDEAVTLNHTNPQLLIYKHTPNGPFGKSPGDANLMKYIFESVCKNCQHYK